MTKLRLGSAGRSSPVARQAHNLKVVGSNPTPATNFPYIVLTVKMNFDVGCSVKRELLDVLVVCPLVNFRLIHLI